MPPEVVQLVVLPPEQLGQQDAGHGQRFFRGRCNLGHGVLGAGHHLPPLASHPAGEQEENRQNCHRYQGKLPGNEHHGDNHGNQRRRVGYGVSEGAGHHRLDAVDVVGNAGLHFPGAGAGQEVQRHSQQVSVDCFLQVSRDVLPHLAGQVGLGDVQRAARHGDGRHQPGQQPEQHQVQPSVGREEGRVENLPDKHRVDHAQNGVDHYQQTNSRNRQLVGAEETNDTPSQAVATGIVELPVKVGLSRVCHHPHPVLFSHGWTGYTGLGARIMVHPYVLSIHVRLSGRLARAGSWPSVSVGTMLPSLYTTPSWK